MKTALTIISTVIITIFTLLTYQSKIHTVTIYENGLTTIISHPDSLYPTDYETLDDGRTKVYYEIIDDEKENEFYSSNEVIKITNPMSGSSYHKNKTLKGGN